MRSIPAGQHRDPEMVRTTKRFKDDALRTDQEPDDDAGHQDTKADRVRR